MAYIHIIIAAAEYDPTGLIKDGRVKTDDCDVTFLAVSPGEQIPWLPFTVDNALSRAKDQAFADLATLSLLPWVGAELAAT